MRRKRGNTNIKILQSQLQNIALKEDVPTESINSEQGIVGKGMIAKQDLHTTPIVEKIPKKKGIKKDELINTKRLLTM